MKREALESIINLGIACDRVQAAHYGMKDDGLIATAQAIQRLILVLADEVKAANGIKEEQPRIFKPAFPKATRKHL